MSSILLVMLSACGGKESDTAAPAVVDPVERWGEPTDTVPSFYGFVPKNILMISIDTFRRDSLVRYGGPETMPFMEGLADKGVLLDDHRTCSNWTMAGTTCTLYGRYNEETPWVPALSKTGQSPVPEAPVFLAEALGEAGYWSVILSGNSWLSPEWNNTQGYDHAETPEDYDYAPRLATTAFDELARAQGRGEADGPWLVHLHLMEPHAAYRPPPEYLSGLDALEPVDIDLSDRDAHYRSNQDWVTWGDDERRLYEQHLWVRYRAELTYLDDLLGRIFVDAAERKLLDDTLVVFWNDHGEAFFEHGIQTHAYTLHGPENDGFAMLWADNIVPGSWGGPTTSIDLAPTLLQLQGVAVADGMTGTPVGEAAADRARFGWSYSRGPNEVMIEKEYWKLIFQIDGWPKLFDREVDPGELDDLWAPDHPKVTELWPLLAPRIELVSELTGRPVTWPEGLEPE